MKFKMFSKQKFVDPKDLQYCRSGTSAKKEKKIKDKGTDFKELSIAGIGIAIVIFVINLVFFSNYPQIFAILNLVAVVIALAMPLYSKFRSYEETRNMEEMFPRFLRDVTDNINAGMTLPQAVRTASNNAYGDLTSYVKELSAKIGWGIPFDKAFMSFAEKTKSKIITRTAKSIIEVHHHGGSIHGVLGAITSSVLELERIKKERATSIYGPMVTGYFIFFLFLGIMLTMARVLIPAFMWEGSGGIENVKIFFTDMFRNMVVIQGIFAGLGIGKMAEGSITAGFKHAFVLGVVGYTVFVLV